MLVSLIEATVRPMLFVLDDKEGALPFFLPEPAVF